MKHLIAAVAACMLGGCASIDTAPQAAPKHILFFLADGLGLTTMTAARIYAVGEEGELTIDTLPESAFVKTFANNAQVTDSASSMTAYMTGMKVDYGVVAMTGDTRAAAPGLDANGKKLVSRCSTGTPAPTLLEMARERGWATGVVTTTSVTDATPAATYAHVCNRYLETDIAASLVPGKVDVILGGGRRAFRSVAAGGLRSDGRDLLAELQAGGYALAANRSDLAGTGGSKLVGLFAEHDMQFDAVRDAAVEPSLSEMTAKAIDVLAKNPQGFFLMVEGGLIDGALHASNAKRALQETVAFDAALKTAIGKMRAIDPGLKNTLIVATADHDHTLILNGYARRTGPTTAAQPGVLGLVHKVSDNEIRLDADGAPYTIIGFGTGEHRIQGKRSSVPPLTDAIVSADGYKQEAAVRTAPDDETHGGTDVYLGAIGTRANTFRGTIDNTRVFELIKAAAGWETHAKP